MSVRRFFLGFPHRADGRVLWSADRTLRLPIDVVQTALMEGMLAHEMHRWKVEIAAAGGTTFGVEDGGVGG